MQPQATPQATAAAGRSTTPKQKHKHKQCVIHAIPAIPAAGYEKDKLIIQAPKQKSDLET